MSKFYDIDVSARLVLDDIAVIANALTDLGIPAGDKLWRCVEKMRDNLNEYRALHAESVQQRLTDAEQSTANMMGAILAMAEITGEEAQP